MSNLNVSMPSFCYTTCFTYYNIVNTIFIINIFSFLTNVRHESDMYTKLKYGNKDEEKKILNFHKINLDV